MIHVLDVLSFDWLTTVTVVILFDADATFSFSFLFVQNILRRHFGAVMLTVILGGRQWKDVIESKRLVDCENRKVKNRGNGKWVLGRLSEFPRLNPFRAFRHSNKPLLQIMWSRRNTHMSHANLPSYGDNADLRTWGLFYSRISHVYSDCVIHSPHTERVHWGWPFLETRLNVLLLLTLSVRQNSNV